MMYYPKLSIVQQGNADYWATQARSALFNALDCESRGRVALAEHYRGVAIEAQRFADHEAHAARYHIGVETTYPT